MRSVTRAMRSWKVRYSSSALRVGAATWTKHEPADPFRALLEQALDRVQPLEDALGVVEAVDADREAGVGRQLPGARTRGAGIRPPAARRRARPRDGHSIEIG